MLRNFQNIQKLGLFSEKKDKLMPFSEKNHWMFSKSLTVATAFYTLFQMVFFAWKISKRSKSWIFFGKKDEFFWNTILKCFKIAKRGKVFPECAWNDVSGENFSKRSKLVFFSKKMGFFKKTLKFFKTAKGNKFFLEWISIAFIA